MLAGFVVTELDRRLAAMIQPGTIAAIDYTTARARVRVGDWISAWLPWQSRAGQVTSWCPPTVGEQCLLLSASGMPELGFILTGFYSETYQPADQQPQTIALRLPDGAQLLYDCQSRTLGVAGIQTITISNAQTITVESSDTVTIKAPQLLLQGELRVEGSIQATGDIQADGISLQQHRHQAQGSNAETSPPQ